MRWWRAGRHASDYRTRPRPATITAAILVLVAAGGPAAADVELGASYLATVGATDNALSAPGAPPPGVAGPRADLFTITGPGLTLRSIRPRRVHQLAYRFNVHLYQETATAASYSHRLDWEGMFALSPRTELLTGALASPGRTTAFDLTVSEAGTIQPPITEHYATASARALFVHQLRPPWRLDQSSTVAYRQSLERFATTPTTLEGTTALTVERVRERSAHALTTRLVGTGSWPASGDEAGTARAGARIGVEGRWRRDLSRTWASELRAGVDQLLTDVVLPTASGGGALRYLHERGIIELGAAREVRTDLFYGHSYVAEEVSLRGVASQRWLPRDVNLSARSAALRVYTVGDADVDSSPHYVIAGAATLGWQTNDYLTLELGYLIHRQLSDDAMRDYLRQTASVTMTISYPGRRPRDRSSGPRQPPLRVDGTDQPDADDR